MDTNTGRPRAARRHDLDWVRTLAIFTVVWCHAAQLFTGQLAGYVDPAVPRTAPVVVLREANYFFHQWRMALVFAISGVVCAATLGRRGGGGFAFDRLRRVAVPLAFGVVTLLPAQLYYMDGRPASFAAYYGGLAAVVTGERVLRLGHLWFLAYLLLADLVTIPGVLLAPAAVARRWRRWSAALFARPYGVPAVALLAAAACCLPTSVVGEWTVLGVADFKQFVFYLVFYAGGLALGASPAAWEQMVRRRRGLLGLALAVQAIVYALRELVAAGGSANLARLEAVAVGGLAWLWVTAVLAYGRAHLTRETRLLRYTREASYPVYLIHYPVLLVLAAPVAGWGAPVPLRFAVLGAATTVLTLGLYHGLARATVAGRFLFGLRPLPAPSASPLHRDVRELLPAIRAALVREPAAAAARARRPAA